MRNEKTKPGKKSIQKIFSIAWFMDKKLAKNCDLAHYGLFCQFFVHNSGSGQYFSKCFFSWLSFFNTHLLMYILSYFETKKFQLLNRGWQIYFWLGLLQFWSKNIFLPFLCFKHATTTGNMLSHMKFRLLSKMEHPSQQA